MAELWFYHLERTSLETVLPELLEKTLARGWRARVEVGSTERAEAICNQLWTYRDDSFLPHGLASDGHAEDEPVLIATEGANVNKADVLFLIEGGPLSPSRIAAFERAILIFDGHDESATTAARTQWRIAKDADIPVAYWQQSAGGKWEKKG